MASAPFPGQDADLPVKMSPDSFHHHHAHHHAHHHHHQPQLHQDPGHASTHFHPHNPPAWDHVARQDSQSPLGNDAANMSAFDDVDTPFAHPPHVMRPMTETQAHYANDWRLSRAPPAGYASFNQDHAAICAQHASSDGDMPMSNAPPCSCMSAYAQVPPAVPTPPPSDGSGPLSPRLNGEWMTLAGGVDSSLPKRIRLSQCLSSNSPVLRPDGVRKKNAKFDIPEDRNLDTLDTLIKHSKNEVEIKELKMQKRLLRNREAALHSRQKKKTHTEQLEKDNERLRLDNDNLRDRAAQLQDDLASAQARSSGQSRDHTDWRYQQSQLQDRIRHLQLEKDQLADAHAKETSSLRDQLTQMRDALQQQQSLRVHSQPRQQASHQARQRRPHPPAASDHSVSPLSSVPSTSPTEYADFANDMGNVHLDSAEWDRGFDFVNDFCLEPGKLTKRRDEAEQSAAQEMVVG